MNLESVEEDEGRSEADFPVEVEASGRLEDGFTALSDLTDLDVEDFLLSDFLFFSGGALKPGDLEVLWPSTTPTTDTRAGSTRVGLRVSSVEGSLEGVDLASRFSFFSL